MSTRQFYTTGMICLLFGVLIGCGHPRITGKVIFPDGTPLSKGQVVFENEKHTYTGKIREDGTFRMGVLKDGEGIPPGKYQVAVSGANDEEIFDPEQPPRVTPLIAARFRSPKTSGLEFDIQKSTTDISIVVEKP
ncbi:MAG: carboxypeptidase-like regulatory domain-containing protein [Planctomycetaceae bacterium]|jgi:hypothetical protein|nr:carboxypeptidase-like regulatory domain-containing protein [Planctomycetaceae bacterium]